MVSIPLNLRGIIVVAIALSAMMVVYIQLNSKDKLEYEKTTGQVSYIDKQLGQLPLRDLGKYRYLKVEGYEFPFEIFVGSESGDFKPKFEQLDNIAIGDTITIFYYQTEDTKRDGLNRFTQYIDKRKVSYFERGDSSKTLGGVVILMSVLLTIGGFILWKKKKIGF